MGYCNSLEQLAKLPDTTKSIRLYLSEPKIFQYLERFTRLEELEMYNVQLQEIPDSIGGFKQLQKLSIGNAERLERISPEIGKLEQLEYFGINHHNRLTTLPSELARCTQLRTLSLHLNLIEKLPDWIGELKHLQTLNLFGYYSSYYDCPRLEVPWRGLTEALRGCTELQTISAQNLGMTELPDFWDAFPKLETLNLDHNLLQTLPASLSRLPKLQNLRADYNEFTELPEVLFSCQNLHTASFIHCHLTTISPRIAQMPRLRSLALATNKLRKVPAEIWQCPSLQTLSLRGNQLTTLPKPSETTPLQYLDINENRLKSLPDGLGALQNLAVHFEQNPYTEPPLFFLYRNNNTGFTVYSKQYPAKFRRHGYDLLAFFAAKRIPNEHRLGIYHLLCRDKAGMEKHVTLETALHALSSNILPLCEHAWKWIEAQNAKRWKKEQPQAGSSSVALLGVFASGAEVAQQQLEALGIRATTKVEADTTHVFVGMDIIGLSGIDWLGNALVATPAQLTEFLHKNEQFYLAEKPGAAAEPSYASEHLSGLLCSADEQNIAVALEMMATGGVPRDLWTDLYIARQSIQNEALADQCYRLMLLHTQKRMTTLPILRQRYMRKEEWERIWKAVQGGLLDWKKIKPFLERLEVNYTRFYWAELAPEERPAVVEEFLRARNYRIEAYLFPDIRMIEDFPQIRCLRMKWYGMQTLPKQICAIADLEELDLESNSLTDLPADFAQLKKLHTLNIVNNNFRKFPAVFNQMPALKTIRCEHNAFATRLHTQLSSGAEIKTVDTEVYDLSGLPGEIRRRGI